MQSQFTRPDLRVKLMRAQVQFKEEIESLQSPISTIESAMMEILDSENLVRVLLVALSVGNIINGVSSVLSPS